MYAPDQQCHEDHGTDDPGDGPRLKRPALDTASEERKDCAELADDEEQSREHEGRTRQRSELVGDELHEEASRKTEKRRRADQCEASDDERERCEGRFARGRPLRRAPALQRSRREQLPRGGSPGHDHARQRADDAGSRECRDPDEGRPEVRDHGVGDETPQIRRATREESAANGRGQSNAVQEVLHLDHLDDRRQQAGERQDLNECDKRRWDEDAEVQGQS